MEKYISKKDIIELFNEDAEMSFAAPIDALRWALNIIEDCPEADIIVTPVRPGQRVWLTDGTECKVVSLYIGAKGVQRIFIRLPDGTEKNLTPKGIGKDIFLEDPNNY